MGGFFDYSAVNPEDDTSPGAVPASGSGSPTEASGFLSSFRERDWLSLRRHSTVELVRSGEMLVRTGEIDRSLFIVISGVLGVLIEGQAEPVGNIQAGDVFGEVAFFDGVPRSSTVVAVEETQVMRLRFEAFEPLAAADPVLAQKLLLDLGKALAGRLRAAEARGIDR